MNRTMVIAISILLAFCAGIYFWTEWQKKEFDASLPKPPAVEEQQVADDTAGGHWHGDEWHAEPHRDAVLNEGMHFTDLREQIDVLTGNPEFQESPTYELPPGISHEDARRVHEAYKKWDREVRQPAHDEWLELIEGENRPPLARLKGEELLEYLFSLSKEENEKATAALEAHIERQQAAWERYQAVERDKPDFVTEVLGGE